MSHSLRLRKFLVCSSSSCTPGSVLSWLASLPTSFCGSLNYTVQFGCVIFRVLQCLWCHVLESLARISLTSGMFLTFTVLFLDVGWMCLLPALSASCALPGSLCWDTQQASILWLGSSGTCPRSLGTDFMGRYKMQSSRTALREMRDNRDLLTFLAPSSCLFNAYCLPELMLNRDLSR